MGKKLTAFYKVLCREELTAVKSFVKWLVISIAMGIIIGLTGALFYYCSASAEFFREEHHWMIFLLPVAGVAIAFFYKALNYSHDRGTNLVLLAVRDNEKMGLRHAACIFVASVTTHLCGGSSGREGASLQIGAALGSQFGRTLRLDEHDRRILTMCGMSAMFSAVFGTPVTAAIFAMEVISIGIFHYSAIVPCVLSAVIANYTSSLFGASHLHMHVSVPELSPGNFLKIIFLGAICALLSIVFCLAMTHSSRLFRRIENTMIRGAVGGAIVVVLTLLAGTDIYNGTGGAMIMSAFDERPFVLAFLIKMLFTVVTLGSGFKGGEILPVFFIGSSFGSVFSQLLGLDCSIGAAIGMAALFCGVTNCPIATILLCVELFGSEGLPFYVIAVAVSYMLSGYRGLYSEQTILYSKTKTQYINQKIGGKK